MKIKARMLLFFFLLFSIITLEGQIIFEESAEQMGINHSYLFGQSGGGVSFVDFNGDGLDDLTLATANGELIHFYRNNGNGFSRNAPLIGDNGEQKQILWADYDNDGDKDLFICVKGRPNRLYQNDGDLQLTDITESAGLPLDTFDTFNACWADFNRDGWLDLYVCERVPLNQPLNRNYLYFNNADGTFTDVSISSNATAPERLPFSSSALDYNKDMWPDIYIANDKDRGNILLHNEGQGIFSDYSVLTGSDYEMDGMSVALGDFDRDGDSDMYITNSPKGNVLARNELDSFTNVSNQLGVSFGGTAWGANFLDAENDGDLDLYVSGSDFGSDEISAAFLEQINRDSFTVVKNGFEMDTVVSYANAVGDFNNDGLPDIAVVNWNRDKSFLFVNFSNEGKYLKIELEGVVSNRDGIGANLEIYHDASYQSYYTHSGIGFLGQNSQQVIFGLGEDEVIDSLIVEWPSGHIDKYLDVPAAPLLKLKEGMSTGDEIFIDEDVTIKESNFPSETNNFEPGANLTVYPNPFMGEIKIDSESKILEQRLYDSIGNLVIFHAGITPGVYFLQLTMEDGSEVTRKVIKADL